MQKGKGLQVDAERERIRGRWTERERIAGRCRKRKDHRWMQKEKGSEVDGQKEKGSQVDGQKEKVSQVDAEKERITVHREMQKEKGSQVNVAATRVVTRIARVVTTLCESMQLPLCESEFKSQGDGFYHHLRQTKFSQFKSKNAAFSIF